MMLLARRQFHPGRASMGFAFSGLREIVERERQMPILGPMTDLDFDVWDEGGRLLQKVEQAAL
jgi:hypothetical protein